MNPSFPIFLDAFTARYFKHILLHIELTFSNLGYQNGMFLPTGRDYQIFITFKNVIIIRGAVKLEIPLESNSLRAWAVN